MPIAAPARSLLLLCVLALACLLACPRNAAVWPEDDGFDDHTVGRIDDRAMFDARAAIGLNDSAALKFVILDFGSSKSERVRYLDGRFYEFHDQWYWYRLLNGHAVPGSRERPLTEREFGSVEDIVAWVRSRDKPAPLGLREIDGRLYSDHFYQLAVHRERRVWGIGTIVHLPARTGDHPRAELWGFELEYADELDTDTLEHFFAALRRSLPDEIAEQLRYIARSPSQAALVARLRASKHALAERVMSYAELAIPGEIEVYNPGLIAGRLRKLPDDPARAAKLLTAGDPQAIWMMPTVPDELPAAAGLLTATPQTPLAHVNLLARNRGIPNAYIGGLFDDPHLDQLSRIHAPVVVLASADGSVEIQPISDESYARWLGSSRPQRPTLTPVDASGLPYVIDLEREPLRRVPELRRIVGGKASAFPVLHAAGVAMPERPLAITIRPYVEHIAELRPLLKDILGSPALLDPRVRYLLLEGRKDFDARFGSDADQTWVAGFERRHPAKDAKHDAIANLLARGGIKEAIRERELDAEAAAAIDAAVRAHFGQFAASQGLRFRSSSTVEDIAGFSGAGLYDSNTGFLDPGAGADAKKTVAWALRKTWASYWSWEAFEERRAAGIDHLAGAMAVLVHARFEDELERSNAVLTLSLDVSADSPGAMQAPPRVPARPRAELEVDVQVGALSVTNPPPERAGEVLPEVDRVILERADGPVKIERVGRSTELPDGHVLDDAALEGLLRDSLAIATRWLEIENLGLAPSQARTRVTLDLEVRELDPRWPAYADPAAHPSPASSRLIIKQVRSLDGALAPGLESLLEQPIPRDLLLVADRVERRRCRGRRGSLDLLELWTDPTATPDPGFAQVPFLARMIVQANGVDGGPRRLDLDHLAFVEIARGNMALGGPWSLAVELDPSNSLGRVESSAGLLRMLADGRVLLEDPAPCSNDVLFASPDEFLRTLLEQARAIERGP